MSARSPSRPHRSTERVKWASPRSRGRAAASAASAGDGRRAGSRCAARHGPRPARRPAAATRRAGDQISAAPTSAPSLPQLSANASTPPPTTKPQTRVRGAAVASRAPDPEQPDHRERHLELVADAVEARPRIGFGPSSERWIRSEPSARSTTCAPIATAAGSDHRPRPRQEPVGRQREQRRTRPPTISALAERGRRDRTRQRAARTAATAPPAAARAAASRASPPRAAPSPRDQRPRRAGPPAPPPSAAARPRRGGRAAR